MFPKKTLAERLQDYVNQLKTFLNEWKYNPFYNEEKKFINILIETFRNNKLNYIQRADRVIKMINSVLFIPDKFNNELRTRLTQLKNTLIRDVHPTLVTLPKEKNEESNAWATYKNLCSIAKGMTIQAGNYYSKRTSPQNWITFNLTYDALATYPYKVSNDDDLGWKLHISFDHANPDNVEKGMNIVLKHLVNEQVSNFKIIPNDKPIRDEIEGKDVTIYISENRSKEEWQKLLSIIETDLLNAKIIPGKQASYTEQIEGSQFTAYRNDRDGKGNYIQNAFNAANEPDTLKEINISRNISSVPTQNSRSFR